MKKKKKKNRIALSTIITGSLLALLSSGCVNHSSHETATADIMQKDTFEFFVAPVGPQNPRNSEAAIVMLKDSALLLGWTEFYAGDGEDHGPARLRGKISTDAGRTWSEKYTLVENDGGRNVMEVNFLRLTTGDLALFYCQKNTESTDCRVMMRTSPDEGKTWVNAKQLSPSGKYTGMTNGRAIRLSTGRILVEVWEGGDVYCLLSDDDGKTWKMTGWLTEANQHPGHITRLKNGDLLLTFGNRQKGANGVAVKISKDNGQTWGETQLIVSDLASSDCGYPASTQFADGSIMTVYYANANAVHQRYHMGTVIWRIR